MENKKMKVCFFAKVDDESYLKRVGFYQQDIKALVDLDFEVHTAINIRQLFYKADLYVVWWWTWAFLPLIFAKLRRKPIIIIGVFDHYIDLKPLDYFKRPMMHKFLLKLCLRYANANVFVSNYEYEHILKYFKVNNPKVSHLTIDTNLYRSNSDLSRNTKTLFTISWLKTENIKRKKIREIIKAMPKILEYDKEIKLIVAGKKHDAMPELEQLVSTLKLHDNVIFTDAISEEEKIKYLQTCTIYVQPTEVEGFGLAILEAMACGAPVLSSFTGTVPEVMGSTGFYVNGDNVDLIADEVIAILKNSVEANISGINAEKRAQKFSFVNRMNELHEIIKDVLKIY